MKYFIDAYLPSDYQPISQRAVTIDGEAATLLRYQPQENTQIQLGETHFSLLTDKSDCLKGFVWLAPQFAGGKLPPEQTAQTVADTFLQNYAPDLYANKETHWIAPHNETIQVNNQSLTLTGMKVKMRHAKNGLWFWVIVGNHGKPMVFERDIVWISFPGKRQTEKWLHDAWLAKQ